MEHRLCFISRNYRDLKSAGNKAKTDYEQILRGMGATNLGLKTTFFHSQVLTFLLNLAGIVKMVFTVRPGDLILLQYPVKKYFSFICRVARLRGAKTIALIHDLGCMRRKKLTEQQELKRLAHADVVIASNETMRQWLKDRDFTKPLDVLGLHDYLSTLEAGTHHFRTPLTVVYAGSLSIRKNAFLLKMAEQVKNYELEIIGDRSGLPELQESPLVRVSPFMSADTFIHQVQGDFGLVWDGDSLDTCSGDFGEYLRWNTPHKVSFYIRAGMPVIVWKESAVAPIVEREGIGVCINGIEKLNTILPALTTEQLIQMRQHVKVIGDRMAHGDNLREAISRVIRSHFDER